MSIISWIATLILIISNLSQYGRLAFMRQRFADELGLVLLPKAALRY
jgi:hypothetical protein